ncbi:MAG TPA: proton-conducting transporter membrane subunit [Xanthobacteraceae bacterium]|nr:proton-conducting transporter membrane subunit [Xanthobacteraceae bacterium]
MLLVLALTWPVAGLLAMLVAARHAERIALASIAAGCLVAAATLASVAGEGRALDYVVGGWLPPLGLALRADGLAAMLLAMSAAILGLVALSARSAFAVTDDPAQARAPFAFWALLLGLACALNLVFLGQDLFSLFVGLELLTFSAVPLVCLDGKRETLAAALRYLLFALVGSAFYLLGTALLYGAYGTLDLASLRLVVRDDASTALAVALMIVGLMAKTAVFPLHLWLPPAHAGAPAAASAVLSALVVKAPFVLILRLWFEVLPGAGAFAGELLAACGAASVIVCSVVALRQQRLKLMIAYSTVAQIGYLFLIFPLSPGPDPFGSLGLNGGVLQLLSHGFAKAAMFVAAGVLAEAAGHDRIADLAGAGRAAPLSVAAFGLAALSLVGLPPSGGFNAKVMLLSAAVALDQWWIALTILAGGLIAAGYAFRVLERAMAPAPEGCSFGEVTLRRQSAALALAFVALALGFVPLQPIGLLSIGQGVSP